MVRHRTHKRHRQRCGLRILQHIAPQKIAKTTINQVANIVVFVDMLRQKRHEVRQIAVWERTTIHLFDHLGRRQAIFVEKQATQCLGRLMFQTIAHKLFTDRGATTLVAKYKAERRHVLHNLRAIVQSRIGAGAQNAGDATRVLQQRTRCRHQVGMHLYFGMRELDLEQAFQRRNFVGSAADEK